MYLVPRTVRSRAKWQRREHACQPSEGESSAVSWVGRCCKFLKTNKFFILTICDEYAQPVELGESGFEHICSFSLRFVAFLVCPCFAAFCFFLFFFLRFVPFYVCPSVLSFFLPFE